MRFQTLLKIGASALYLVLAGGAMAQSAPDLIIYNAHIVTVDGNFSIASAAAVSGGKFSAVGDDKTVLATAGRGTKKINLHGQTVLPGFDDTHVHQMGTGLYGSVDLTNIHSIVDIQNGIAAAVKNAKPGEWINGTRGWWEYDLKEGRLPTRYDLDKVAPNNPVSIPGPHYAIVNSLALKMGNVTKDTPNPRGGEIQKDPKTGEPTGLLFDAAARLVRPLGGRDSADRAQAVRLGTLAAMKLDNSNGLTSIGDPSVSMDGYNLYKQLLDEGLLTTRVDMAFNINPNTPLGEMERQFLALGKPESHTIDGMLRADEIGEALLDGAEQTALLRYPYPGKPDYTGLEMVPQRQYNEFANMAAKYGYRLRPHAVGDAAIDEALTAFEYANMHYPIKGRRWMIDHAFLLGPDHYPRVKALGVLINSQYMHNAQLGKLILAAWQRPLADRSEPYKEWLANGIMFAGGSDGPISYHAIPLYEIYGEVTRNTMWGGKLGPDQGITLEQAIRSVTINGAYTTFEENVKGSIEPGKYADFVLLSNDILQVPAEKIKDIKVLATVLGGKTVYGSLE